MSRATELAKAEADKAEAEDVGEDEAPPEVEDESEALAESEPDDGVSLEASLKAFEKENERHADEVASIMGADFDAMTPCENCNGVGFRPADPYKRDPNLQTCEACAGYGILVTGSLNPDKAVQPCITCGGNGFVTKPMASPVPAAPAPVAMFDPYTGQPVPSYAGGPVTPTSPNGEWAPGFVPPPQPLPGRS